MADRVSLNRTTAWNITNHNLFVRARENPAPRLLSLPSGGVAQRGKDADADGQQTGRNEQGQQRIAGHQVPAFAHELNHGIQSAHNCAHPAAGYHGRSVTHVIASFPQNFICNTFHAAAAKQLKEKCVTIVWNL